MPSLLSTPEIESRLGSADGWSIENDQLTKTYAFDSYLAGAAFAQHAAEAAEAMNHHPDILIRWRQVTLTISTHSAGGITELDFDFATRIDH